MLHNPFTSPFLFFGLPEWETLRVCFSYRIIIRFSKLNFIKFWVIKLLLWNTILHIKTRMNVGTHEVMKIMELEKSKDYLRVKKQKLGLEIISGIGNLFLCSCSVSKVVKKL